MLELRPTCEHCNTPLPPDARNWKGDNYLGKDPASIQVKHRPVDPTGHARFAGAIRSIPPERR